MASKNISFDAIPASIRKPGKYFEFNTKLAVRTLPGNLQRTVIIAQKTSAGLLPANTIADVFSDVQAATFGGAGSMLHLMVRAALTANPYLALSVVALDDAGAGVAQTWTATAAGTATSAGVATLFIANQLLQVAVSVGDTAAVIAAALKAQADKQPDLPVAVTVAGAVLTLTAKHKGLAAGQIPVGTQITATGVTLVSANGATGATDPSLTAAFSALFSAGFNVYISPYNTTTPLQALRDHLDAVSGPLEQRGAFGTTGFTGTLSAATTVMSTVNPQRISGALAPSILSTPWEVAAGYGAVAAFEEDPAKPLNTLAINGLAPIPLSARLGRTEIENALYNGVTPLEVGPGERVQIVRAITGYILDPQGIPDISLLDLTTIRTLDYVRKAVRERISLRFPRDKLSSRTPAKVVDETMDVLYKLEELEIIEEVDANKAGVIAERDLQDPNRLDLKIPVDVVNGLHVVAGRIDLLL